MAGERRRRHRNQTTLYKSEAGPQPDKARYRSPEQGRSSFEGGGEAHGLRETRLTLNITVRRVRINPEKKRVDYLVRLERMMNELNDMLSNPDTIRSAKLRGMDVMIRTVKACYSIVRDIDVEEIEDAVEKIKAATRQPDVDFAPLDDVEGSG